MLSRELSWAAELKSILQLVQAQHFVLDFCPDGLIVIILDNLTETCDLTHTGDRPLLSLLRTFYDIYRVFLNDTELFF